MTLQQRKNILIEKIKNCENQELIDLIVNMMELYTKTKSDNHDAKHDDLQEQNHQIDDWNKEVETVFGNENY